MAAIGVALAIVLFGSLGLLFLRTPAARLAHLLRIAVPVVLGVIGAGLLLAGRGAIGLPILGLAIAAWRRLQSRRSVTAAGDRVSTVRSRFLDMTLDHVEDRLDGRVLEGTYEGALLSELDREQLLALHRDYAGQDGESGRLLETYLDRRMPGWRANTDPDDDAGLRSPPGAGAMAEQEAYEILGLQPGATLAEIREAHRRLMKRVHPDLGGSDALAARINEAKALLVDRHH